MKSIVLVQNGVGIWEPDKMFPCVSIFSVIEVTEFQSCVGLDLEVVPQIIFLVT